jgi:3-oxoacyl-[acyl-carrier-protein] synthase II
MVQTYRDHKSRPIVAVTGIGVISSLGEGRQDNWSKLINGQSGIHRIKRFETEGLRTTVAGTVDFLDDVLAKQSGMSAPALSLEMAKRSGLEAIAQSGLSTNDFPGALFLASPPVEMEWQHRFKLHQETQDLGGSGYERLIAGAKRQNHKSLYELLQFGGIADNLQSEFGTKGLPISLSTACASGTTAIQLGVEAIRRGETDSALCIGTDGSVNIESLIRFSLLSALTTQNDDPTKASKPFSKDRDGFVMAEGSGALVLESLESATARGAEVLAIIHGCGEKADDFHRTRAKPDGSPIIAAVKHGLQDAGVGVDGISYINAHGTSTPENDRMEFNSMSAVFGSNLKNIPISSNKSMIGHTLTAAGAIEAVFSIMTLMEGRIPPTINHNNPDPDIDLDVVPNVARDTNVATVLSSSFGFGGQNACLVMGIA